MLAVIFVCHGNICRSPMAESVFYHLVKEAGLENQIRVDSAAAHTDELGNPPYYRTQEVLKSKKIPLVPHKARLLTAKDGEVYDYIIGMDDYNVRDILRIVGDRQAEKVHRLLDFTAAPHAIADPWYTRDFETTFQEILGGSKALLAHITAKKSQ